MLLMSSIFIYFTNLIISSKIYDISSINIRKTAENDSVFPEISKDSLLPILNIINSETVKCQQFKTRSEQNKNFSMIECPSELKPIRLTSSSSVFGIKINGKKYVIKRYIEKNLTERKEDKICMQLNHENVIKTFFTFTQRWRNRKTRSIDKVNWIISEFLDTPVTNKYVAKSEKTIRKICKDVVKGLIYLHDMGIAHLDMKMGNIMGKQIFINDKPSTIYKIIDFGFAREIQKNEIKLIPNRYYGTFPFAPPEIYFDSMYSQKADIWSLGAIAYHLSSDRRLFYDQSERDYDWYEHFLSGNQKFFFDKHISEKLKKFVKRCMKINIGDRPTAEELLDDEFLLSEY